MTQSTPPLARDRYERALAGYRRHISGTSHCTLRSYCRDNHVNYDGMKKWMYSSGLSVKSLKQESSVPSATLSDETGSRMLLPVIPATSEGRSAPSGSILSGVTLTFPDGTVLSVRRCSPEALVELVTCYRKEVAPCSR